MINHLLGLFSFDLGIDMGTANTLIYVVGKGIAVREPSLVARNKKTKEILAVGREAAKMLGKTGNQIEVIRPLKNGVVSDFAAAAAVLTTYIKKVHERGRFYPTIPRPKVVIGIPSSISEIHRKALMDVAKKAGARKVILIDEALAASLGIFQNYKTVKPHGIVDIGGGTTDIGFIVDQKVSIGKSIQKAGDAMTEVVGEFIKMKYSLLVGEPTAEKAKIALADAKPTREMFYVIRGRDLESGFPKSIKISNFEVHEAIKPVLDEIISELVTLIKEAPPELSAGLTKGGLILTGGGALIKNLAQEVTRATTIQTKVADDPLTSVVRGCSKMVTAHA